MESLKPMNALAQDPVHFRFGAETPDLGVAFPQDTIPGYIAGTHPTPPPPLAVARPLESKLVVSPGTPLACTSCHRMGMPVYYLKRCNGRYDVLCFDNGKGCWEHSARSLCNYVDGEAQCTDLAEWLVVYGEDTDLIRRAVCSRHVAAVLSGARSYRLYPIDDDFLAGGVIPATVELSRPGA